MSTDDPLFALGVGVPYETVLGVHAPSLAPSLTAMPALTPGIGPALGALPGTPSMPFEPSVVLAAMIKMAGDAFGLEPLTPTPGPAPGVSSGEVPVAMLTAQPSDGSRDRSDDALNSVLAAFVDVLRFPLVQLDERVEFDPLFEAEGAEENGLDGRGSPRASHGLTLDARAVRREFPILEERVHGRRLVWLDNAATTQKPRAVIDRLSRYYERENSNIHRAAHTLAARATDAYEGARETTRRFLGASAVDEIIFVRGATEGINLVAQTYGRCHVGQGDEIVITWLEHHANIVPWQMLCQEKGARLRVAPVDDRGQIILEEYEKLLNPRTKLVSLTQVSNALGTITPAKEMVAMAHRHGARVLVDGAQSVSHRATNVQDLDADFFVFSGHKVFAPAGIGAVYGKREVLEQMPPWQGGGNMIADVTFERTRYQPPPARFEAGTGSIGDAAGLGAALDWLMRLGLPNVERYEHELLTYATRRLSELNRVKIIGTAPDKAGVVSFVVAGVRTEDVSAALDKEGIAVRSGHHCAQPILRRLGLEATVRASFAPYNVCEDIDALVEAVSRL